MHLDESAQKGLIALVFVVFFIVAAYLGVQAWQQGGNPLSGCMRFKGAP